MAERAAMMARDSRGSARPESAEPGSAEPGSAGPRSGTPGSSSAGSGRSDQLILGYPISGMIAYGAIGALIGKFTHVALLFPIGLFVGLLLGIAAMFYRYHRPVDVRGDRIDR
jgi:hypothetical protein